MKSSVSASPRIPLVNQGANLLVFDEFSPIGSSQALFNLGEEPLVVIDHALHSLHNQRFAVPSLLFGKPDQFPLRIG